MLEFDGWALGKISDLRLRGLKNAHLQERWDGNNKPPELGTVGLAQKLLNIIVKYELVWQVAGTMQHRGLQPYDMSNLPTLAGFVCALHAVIDSKFLKCIYSLPVGVWLKEKGFVKRDGKLVQALDGSSKSWSQLDCLRTYYGLQLVLRRLVMQTWPLGCGCEKSGIEASAKCASWFDEAYGGQWGCGEGPDWLGVASKLPENVIKESLREEWFNTDHMIDHGRKEELVPIKNFKAIVEMTKAYVAGMSAKEIERAGRRAGLA